MSWSSTALLLACTLLHGCTQALWHPWIEKQTVSASVSPRKAGEARPLVLVMPDSSIPQEQARWVGAWNGWVGYGKEVDMSVFITIPAPGKAHVLYSWASETWSHITHLEATFSGSGLNWRDETGSFSMRMRPGDNELELVRRTGRGEIVVEIYGLLARRPGGLQSASDWLRAQGASNPETSKRAEPRPMTVVAPGANVPAAHAKFAGTWTGWFGLDKATHMEVIVASFQDNEALVAYAWANDFGSRSTILRPAFDGEYLVNKTPGEEVRFRLRADGEQMEVYRVLTAEVPFVLVGLLQRKR